MTGAAVRTRAALCLRAWGGTIVALTVLHATAVAWVAWYLADATWTTAPLSASRTPLHAVVFAGTMMSATAVTAVFGLAAGATVGRGTWAGPDPTLGLPVTRASRWLADWIVAVLVVAVVAIGTLPVYVGLHELGGIAGIGAVRGLVAHGVSLGLAPLAGVGLAHLRR